MRPDIDCVFQGLVGVGDIFISGISAAQSPQILSKHNIRAVVSIAKDGHLDHQKLEVPCYLYLPAYDSQEFDISVYFQETFNFIESSRKTTNVLVHCMAGISRSATIVIAYLVRKYSYSIDKVIALLKRRRKKIRPNKGFISQLQNYSLQLQKQRQAQHERHWPQDQPSKFIHSHTPQHMQLHQSGVNSHYKPIRETQQFKEAIGLEEFNLSQISCCLTQSGSKSSGSQQLSCKLQIKLIPPPMHSSFSITQTDTPYKEEKRNYPLFQTNQNKEKSIPKRVKTQMSVGQKIDRIKQSIKKGKITLATRNNRSNLRNLGLADPMQVSRLNGNAR